MKTFGTIASPPPSWGAESRQVRVIVAAKSQKAAVEAFNEVGLNLTVGSLRMYGGPTGNAAEIAAAEAEPGTVLWVEDRWAATPVFNPAPRKAN